MTVKRRKKIDSMFVLVSAALVGFAVLNHDSSVRQILMYMSICIPVFFVHDQLSESEVFTAWATKSLVNSFVSQSILCGVIFLLPLAIFGAPAKHGFLSPWAEGILMTVVLAIISALTVDYGPAKSRPE